jgi:hypothetical protein
VARYSPKDDSLGGFGTFRLRTHGEGAATAEEVTARDIAKTPSPLPPPISALPGAPALPRPETGLCQSRPVELIKSPCRLCRVDLSS